MKMKLLGYMLIFSLFVLTGCEEGDLTPEQAKQVEILKRLEQQAEVQTKINEITKRIEALNEEDKEEEEETAKEDGEMKEEQNKEEETPKADAPADKKEDSDDSGKNKELEELLEQLEELKEQMRNSGGTPETDTTPVADERDPSNCTFNGEILTHGQSKNYYNNQTVPHGSSCQGEVRVCNDGIMSGNASYQYSACLVTDASPAATVETDASCNFGGETLSHGQSKTYYQDQTVSHGSSCQSQERSCNDGTMEGNVTYQYTNCSVEAAPVVATANCSLSGATVNHGNSGFFYSSANVPFGIACNTVRQERTCNNGTLSGDDSYNEISCAVEPEADGGGMSPGDFEAPDLGIPDGVFDGGIPDFQLLTNPCSLDGIEVLHGDSHYFYNTENAPFFPGCIMRNQERTCNNGTLSGDNTFKYDDCITASLNLPDSCTLDGATVTHNSSKMFYAKKTVNFGQSCNDYKQGRTCDDGTLSGNASYKYASCSISVIPDDIPDGIIGGGIDFEELTPVNMSCSLDGVTVSHGNSRVFYDTETTSAISVGCFVHMMERTCNNGYLNGISSYKYATCEKDEFNLPGLPVEAPSACELDGVTVDHDANHIFYSVTQAPSLGVCSSYDQVRTCDDGVLSGSSTYKYNDCEESTMVLPDFGDTFIPVGTFEPILTTPLTIPVVPIPVGPIPGL